MKDTPWFALRASESACDGLTAAVGYWLLFFVHEALRDALEASTDACHLNSSID
jgi:hypothetical protein